MNDKPTEQEAEPTQQPAMDDWEYLGRWMARKLGMDEDSSIYAVMGQMHCVVNDAHLLRKFVEKQKVAISEMEEAELIHLREAVRIISKPKREDKGDV